MNWNDIPTIRNLLPHPNAKLTHDQVRYVREQLKQGVKQDALAHELDVDATTISSIKRNKTYRRLL